eukprot:jgi/Tetstr1/428872/TSEL_001866.t1
MMRAAVRPSALTGRRALLAASRRWFAPTPACRSPPATGTAQPGWLRGSPAPVDPAAGEGGVGSWRRGASRVAAAGTGARPGAGPARPPKQKRHRLDDLVCELHPEYSKNVVQSFILQGKVLVEGQPVHKAGAQVKGGAKVELIASVPKYVCRAGTKLEAAFQRWEIDVAGKVALDAGLSTGGFTDCLLQQGAARVYGVDVGRGQVAEKLRQDPRLVVMEKTNLRHLTAPDLPESVDIVTLDLSFISVLKACPPAAPTAPLPPPGRGHEHPGRVWCARMLARVWYRCVVLGLRLDGGRGGGLSAIGRMGC